MVGGVEEDGVERLLLFVSGLGMVVWAAVPQALVGGPLLRFGV